MSTETQYAAPAPVPALEDGSREFANALTRLGRVARYRHPTILWTLAGTIALGVAYYALAPRYFRSDAKLMVIEGRGEEMSGVADQAGVDGVIVTHRELIRKPVVLMRAIGALAPEHRVDFIDVPANRWIDNLASRLTTTSTRQTNFIGVSYESLDPNAAAAVVAAVIDAYIDFVGETHRSTADQVLEVFTTERDELEAALAAKENELNQLLHQAGDLGLSDSSAAVDPIVSRALQANEALMDARRQRIELQATRATVAGANLRGENLLRYVAAVEETVGERMMLASLGLSEGDTQVVATQQERLMELKVELERLRPYYGDSHPRMVSIKREVAAGEQLLAGYHDAAAGRGGAANNPALAELLTTSIDQALAQVTEREARLATNFDRARAEAAQQRSEFMQYEMLSREVERLEQMHSLLWKKIAAVDIRQIQAPIRATIVQDPLPPERPSSPRLRYVAALAVCSGLSLGLALACLQDVIDDRFPTIDAINTQLSCRVLSVVREFARPVGNGFDAVPMHATPSSSDCEAFRTLRASLMFSADNPERLVVSSSEPSDGKTTVSTNLAVACAQSGKRTLLIDSDLRKPGLTALLNLKRQSGLTDILTSDAPMARAAIASLHQTPVAGLDVIPSGPRRPDPAELLMRNAFAELLAWADTRYDQVIIDCPPVLAVSDAQVVGRLVDGVVLVVSPERNHRSQVRRACDAFWDSGCNLLGVVANRVTAQSGGGYGYDYKYGEEVAAHDEDLPVAA